MDQFTLTGVFPFLRACDRPRRQPLPRDLRAHVWDMTRGRCWYCGTHCNPFHDFCIDHVVPLSRGGDDEVGNLVPCCAACNANKGVLVVEEWRSWFDRADELDEWPWTRPDRRFWFEGGDLDGPHRAGDLDPAFIRDLRNDEVRAWRRTHGDTR